MSLSAFERHRAGQELVTLTTHRTGKTPPDERVDGILALLDDLPLADLLRGLNRSARRDSYFPDAARIRRASQSDDTSTRSQPVPPEVAAAIAAGEQHCADCHDTGWQHVETALSAEQGPMMTERQLAQLPPARRLELVTQWGARVPMYPRGYVKTAVRVCRCRASNPIYRAKRASEARNPRHEREDG